MFKLIVRTTTRCDFCERAKLLLSNKGIDFVTEELDVDNIPALQEKFPMLQRTVPMVFEVTELGETYIGGYTELENKIKLQEQANMLTEVTNFEL